MSNVTVLAGGSSDERAVSLRSGAAIAAALTAAGHTVHVVDPAGDVAQLRSAAEASDCVFPALHGTGGEDGAIQTQLEAWGVPYVGSGPAASKLCFDKWRYKQLLVQHGLPVVTGELVDTQTMWQSPLSRQPFVLKPFDGGSSIDTFIIRQPDRADHTAISGSFERHQQMLLEPLIEGTEATMAVLGGQALPVIEIVPPIGGEFDYDNKYNGASRELCPPEHITQALQAKAQQLAETIHELCGCRDLSRTDCIITADGQLWILETNTLPGFTEQSLFPLAARAGGKNMEQLVTQLTSMALERSARQ